VVNQSVRELRATIDAFARDCHAPHQAENRILQLLLAGLRSASHEGGQIPLLIGGVGVGKTYAAMAAARRYCETIAANPPVYVQIAPPGGGTFNFSVGCGQIMRALGRAPALVDLTARAPWDRSPRHVAVEATQREIVQRRPGVLVLDEIERIFGKGANEKGHLETVVWWADTTGVPIMILGNYEAARAPSLEPKPSRRLLPLHYEPYEGRDGQRPFLAPYKTLIGFLKERRALAESFAADAAGRRLFQMTHGRVGETKKVLILASEIAFGHGRALTNEDLEEAISIKLTAPVRALFDRDLLKGQMLLTDAFSVLAASTTGTSKPSNRRGSKRLPGRRAPSYDPVEPAA